MLTGEVNAVNVAGKKTSPCLLNISKSSEFSFSGHRAVSGPILRRETYRSLVMEKRTFIGMVEAGEPLIKQAIDAIWQYHQAQERGAPPEEIEHLRLLADSLYQAVIDYQLIQAGRAPSTIQ